MTEVQLDICGIAVEGNGGWFAILRYGSHQRELTGYRPESDVHRMSLIAAIKGLEALKRPCTVRIRSCSAFLRKGLELSPEGKLWQRLRATLQTHEVTWVWVDAKDPEIQHQKKRAVKAVGQQQNDERIQSGDPLTQMIVRGHTHKVRDILTFWGFTWDKQEWIANLRIPELQPCRELAQKYDLGYTIFTEPPEQRLQYEKPISTSFDLPSVSVMGQGRNWAVEETMYIQQLASRGRQRAAIKAASRSVTKMLAKKAAKSANLVPKFKPKPIKKIKGET